MLPWNITMGEVTTRNITTCDHNLKNLYPELPFTLWNFGNVSNNSTKGQKPTNSIFFLQKILFFQIKKKREKKSAT